MIIALIGPKRSGKTTAAKYLVKKYGFTRRAFADPLKDMLRVLGLKNAHINGGFKEMPTSLLCGQTPRHAMQTLGTEWGRKLIDPDIWITAWYNTLPKGHVVIDDMRFPNEYQFITTRLESKVIAIRRPGYAYTKTHESEFHELESEFLIENDGSIKRLVRKIDDLFINRFGFTKVTGDGKNQEKKT